MFAGRAKEIAKPVADLLVESVVAHSGQVMMTTSGGRNSPFLISVLGEAANNDDYPPAARKALKNIPVVFIDQQDHPDETLDLLAGLRDRYPYLNFLRFTNTLEPDSLQSEVKHRMRPPKSLDPVKALIEVVKTQALSGIMDWLGWNGMPVDTVISGNRRDQTASRSSLAQSTQQQLGSRTVAKIFPAANITHEESRTYMEQMKLPKHGLPDDKYRSVGIWLEMDPDARHAGTGEKANRLGDECGIHLNHAALEVTPVRLVNDWTERLRMDAGVREWIVQMTKDLREGSYQI